VNAAVQAGVVYEVNLDLEQAIADDYREWLRQHVAQMLALPGFVSAQVFDVAEPAAQGRVAYCVQYRLSDAAALTDYLRDHAARMRQEGIARFGGRFRASRRVLRETN
jgi:antibiotic biosynthesis monooxygenase (ABM) superfamily enzyme